MITRCSVINVKYLLQLYKFSLAKLYNQQFYKFIPHENNMDHSVAVEKTIGSLVLNPSQNLILLFNYFYNLYDETNLHDGDVYKIIANVLI